ncbi:hypothetical protein EJ05DRAFT_507607 [Pseudovirgaria hyperparasitica]|uniref:UBA domain-containing protein n=1 Tax=Pseudovirgaria hyperparasitica TaxID=470096 RepID=A0A6A6WGR8_9PEZI|nr:uncharacterized protein EJ05DRAFT_507607 [Pseudovirgaria hyperparasitica]KAF2762008.1 hypothetical protein EJ05DRAFT_507607 [Pseudovirgaria hyperparasitica]
MRTFVDDSDDGGGDTVSESQSPVSAKGNPAEICEVEETQEAACAGLGHSVEAFTPLVEHITPLRPSSKRRRTINGHVTDSSPTKRLERSKTMRTYGKPTQHRAADYSEINETFRRTQFTQGDTSAIKSSNQSRNPSSQTIHSEMTQAWHLPASLQQEFALHEPNAMFPDPSSTVPDNSSTQKHLVQDAIDAFRAPTVVEISVTDFTTQKTNESSVPWSDYLQTQPAEPAKTPTNAAAPEPPSTTDHTAFLDTLPKLSDSSTRKRKATSSQIIGTPDQGVDSSQTKHRKGYASSTIDPLDSDELAIDLPQEMYKPRPSRSRSARYADDPIDSSATLQRFSRKVPKRSKTSSECATHTMQLSSSEKIEMICAMGFTSSQAHNALQRSYGSLEKAVDQLCNVESQGPHQSVEEVSFVVQTNVHPSKDIDEAQVKTSTEEVTSVATVTATGTSIPVPPKAVDEPTQKEVKAIIDSEDEGDIDSPITENAEYVLAKEANGTSAVEEDLDEEQGTDEDAAVDMRTKMRRTKSMPVLAVQRKNEGTKTKKRRGRPRKEAEVELEDSPKLIDKDCGKTRKGRGRPRKNVDIVLENIESLVEKEFDEKAEAKTDTAVAEEKSKVTTALTEDSPNPNAVRTVLQAHSPPSTPPQQLPASARDRPESRHGPELLSPKKPKALSPHSPLMKGKVSYRVGLSRRARIAPLLRIVKK